MVGLTHLATGMVLQKHLKRPWLYVPFSFLSHGFLDASAVFHDFSAFWTGLLMVPGAVVAWLAWRKRLWVGALFAVLPDFEWLFKAIAGLPAHPLLKWQAHYWLQLPKWNWHGQYGHLWGIPAEAMLAVACLASVAVFPPLPLQWKQAWGAGLARARSAAALAVHPLLGPLRRLAIPARTCDHTMRLGIASGVAGLQAQQTVAGAIEPADPGSRTEAEFFIPVTEEFGAPQPYDEFDEVLRAAIEQYDAISPSAPSRSPSVRSS